MAFIISKRNVDAKAGERDAFYWDSRLTGFGLKVTPAGRRSYFYQYRFGGRLRRFTIGRHGSPWAPDTARREAVRLAGLVADGEDVAATKTTARSALKVRDLAIQYIAEHASAKKKRRSEREDRRQIARVVLPNLGSFRVSDVTHSEVAKLHHSMRSTPYMANRTIALLSKMFGLAEKWGYRPQGTNPCLHIEKFKERKRKRYLSDAELGRLGDALVKLERVGVNPTALFAVRLLVFTGARSSEILTARWDYFDKPNCQLCLPESKSGDKNIPLGPPALEILERLPRIAENPYILPGKNTGMHFVGLPKVWNLVKREASIPDVRIHDLRHSYASVAAGRGQSLLIIGRLLGHRSQAATERYAHLAHDPVAAAANDVCNAVALRLRGNQSQAS